MTVETFNTAQHLLQRIDDVKAAIYKLQNETDGSMNRAYLLIESSGLYGQVKIKMTPSTYASLVLAMLTDYAQQLFDLEREFEQL